jgi:hypothetical protein
MFRAEGADDDAILQGKEEGKNGGAQHQAERPAHTYIPAPP